MDEFKDRIKELRTGNKLTQSQLAVKINRGEATIRAWETGRAKPDAEMLISLSKIFNCTVDYLLGLSNLRNVEEEGEIRSSVMDYEKIGIKIAISLSEYNLMKKKMEQKMNSMQSTAKILNSAADTLCYGITDLIETINKSSLTEDEKESLCKRCRSTIKRIEESLIDNSTNADNEEKE